MKGQFFIIATVIIVASLITITAYFYDYSKIDLTDVSDLQELEYIQDIKDVLNQTAEISYSRSNCNSFIQDMNDAEDFLENMLIEKGIVLIFENNEKICEAGLYSANYRFTLESNGFKSTTSFIIEK